MSQNGAAPDHHTMPAAHAFPAQGVDVAMEPLRGRGRPPKILATQEAVPVNAVAVEQDRLLGVASLCALLDVSRITIYRAIAAGRLPTPRYVTPRQPRWSLVEVKAALEKLRMTPAQAKSAERAARLAAQPAADRRDAA